MPRKAKLELLALNLYRFPSERWTRYTSRGIILIPNLSASRNFFSHLAAIRVEFNFLACSEDGVHVSCGYRNVNPHLVANRDIRTVINMDRQVPKYGTGWRLKGALCRSWSWLTRSTNVSRATVEMKLRWDHQNHKVGGSCRICSDSRKPTWTLPLASLLDVTFCWIELAYNNQTIRWYAIVSGSQPRSYKISMLIIRTTISSIQC